MGILYAFAWGVLVVMSFAICRPNMPSKSVGQRRAERLIAKFSSEGVPIPRYFLDDDITKQVKWSSLESRAGGNEGKASATVTKGNKDSTTKPEAKVPVGKRTASSSGAGSEGSLHSGSPRSPGSPPYGKAPEVSQRVSKKAFKEVLNKVYPVRTPKRRKAGYAADVDTRYFVGISPEHPTRVVTPSVRKKVILPWQPSPKRPRGWRPG